VRYPIPSDAATPCRRGDPERWFPRTGDQREAAKVAKECEACPFKDPCGAWALRYELFGIWAGMSADRRRALRRRQGIRLEPAPGPWLPHPYRRAAS
jgi:hypothetical protein